MLKQQPAPGQRRAGAKAERPPRAGARDGTGRGSAWLAAPRGAVSKATLWPRRGRRKMHSTGAPRVCRVRGRPMTQASPSAPTRAS
eukprot:13056294-Alexandrium_andersonii.AAC.2